MKQDKKQSIIEKYKTHKKDTGSPEVQIALLSEEINSLLEHLKEHRKDEKRYKDLIKKVGLKK